MPSKIEMYVQAKSTLELGSAESAGKHIADMIRFLMTRISPEKRSKALNKLRYKIWTLNEHSMGAKKTPNYASMGQSITFIKTVLNGHDPAFIRDILSHIVRNLY